MSESVDPLDLSKLKVYPLAQRQSLSRVEDILVDPEEVPAPCSEEIQRRVDQCAEDLKAARARGAAVILAFGAHLVKNGGMRLLERLMAQGWVTHLATNGAGSIHDWEFAFQGWSTESVRNNVARGSFGTWDETGRYLHLALLAGGVRGDGYGRSVGRFIEEEGTELPSVERLTEALKGAPEDELAPARADLLQSMLKHGLSAGPHKVPHGWKGTSIFANAFRQGLPITVHPGIGYDIISNHPMFNGAVIGRGAGVDFRLFGRAVERLDGGVMLSIGSAIMAPQVFEKSLSCVNNLRLQSGRSIVKKHSIYVVDLQDGGGWDWTTGEPPKDNPAYYLRFCKSFARMGGAMHYAQCDNVEFLRHLLRRLV